MTLPNEDVQETQPESSGDAVSELFESAAPRDDADETSDAARDEPTARLDSNRLSTGVESLDRSLGGGIPPGRIVGYVAPPDTQSELIVKQLAAVHDCVYLSTLRPKWEVEEGVTDHVQGAGPTGSKVPNVRIEHLDPDDRLDDALRHLEQLGNRSILVIDAMNELEDSEKARYVRFIDAVKQTLWDTQSVGVFYCIEEEDPPSGRAVTLRRADLIWQLRRSVEPGEISHYLVISKFRGGKALTEPVKLNLADEIEVDTSRDIA